jgi:hypothetical protein
MMVLKPMNGAEKVDALRTIIADSERLKNLARNAGFDMLAFQLELVLHEARSILMADGHEPKGPKTPDSDPSGSSVVRLPWPRRPRPRS